MDILQYGGLDPVDVFQRAVSKEFARHRIEKKARATLRQLCYPPAYTLQPPQKFVADFIGPGSGNKGLLIYHKIGAGKTCAAIQIAEAWKHKKHVVFVCPASLVGNFYKELRSACTSAAYVTGKERALLGTLDPQSRAYKTLVDDINTRIEKHYSVLSYNKFVELIQQRRVDASKILLVIDEVQNIVSESGSFYRAVSRFVTRAPASMRVVLLSATPIFDRPIELALTINLLRPKSAFDIASFNDTFLQAKGSGYVAHNVDELRKKLNGMISFYRGAPDVAFPRRRQVVVRCVMSKYQYMCYRIVERAEGELKRTADILNLPTNFLIGPRIMSNIAFPSQLINEDGLKALKPHHLSLDQVGTYSIKLRKLLRKVMRAKGTVFIYSAFKGYGGIKPIIKALERHGYRDFATYGAGKKRFAVWSGDEHVDYKDKIRDVFNHPKNMYGGSIKVMLGSPAIKEGVSLLRVRQVHVLEPHWNMSRLEQIVGRAIRFCSHKDMPVDEREVKVYIYLAVAPDGRRTVDEHIYELAKSKQALIDEFEDIIRDVAVDKRLFQ